MKIDVYTKNQCIYCVKAKKWLSRNGYEYVEHNLDNPEDLRIFKNRNPDLKTVPQIFVDSDNEITHIGGYLEMLSHPFFS